MKNPQSGAQIFQKFWLRQKKADPKRYSLRQVAKAAGLSPGYLSKIFSNQRQLTLEVAQSLFEILKMDEIGKKAVLESFALRPQRHIEKPKNLKVLESFKLSNESVEWLLGKWYRLAILDLMTTSDFQSDPKWISKRLGIAESDISYSLRILEESELAFRDEAGIWRKTHERLRFPTVTSKQTIRDYHKGQLNRALDVLNQKTLPKDFNERLIVGFSIACNPARLEEVKNYLSFALYEASLMLAEENCQEVYQLNLQLFPQTMPVKNSK